MPIIICNTIANYLIVRVFIRGGVNGTHDTIVAQEVQLTASQNVAKKLLITPTL